MRQRLRPKVPFQRLLLSTLGILWTPCVPGLAVAQEDHTPHASDMTYRYPAGSEPAGEWRLGSVQMRLGGQGAPPSQQFFDVVGVVLLPGDVLVVGDGGSSELRFFDLRSGHHIRTIGGEGKGPGEIDRLWSLFRVPGGLAALDAGGFASVFDFDGTFVRRTRPVVSDLARRVRRVGYLDDGRAVGYAIQDVPNLPDGSTTIKMRLALIDEDMPEHLFDYPFYVATRKGGKRPGYLAYGPVTDVAVLEDQFCAGFPETYVIECFTPAGDLVRRIVREDAPRDPVSEEDRQAYFAANDAANPGARGAAYRRFVRENTVFADVRPAFGQLVAGADSELWVGPMVPEGDSPARHPSPPGETEWSVFAKNGSWLADVVMPRRFVLLHPGKKRVVGLIRDALDVESILVFSLERSPG